MDKKSLIALIYKDLYELKVLTNGFSEMENFPKTLVDLAVDKAKNIADCLQKIPINAYEHQELYFDFVQEPITKSQITETKRDEKIEIFEEPKIEKQIEEEIFDAPVIEEKIEIVETQPEIVVEQQIIEEKFEPIIEIPVAKPIVQSKSSEFKQPFGIGIADRFRFQRELFDGNGEKFSKSLADFNEMETLEQAQNYIVKNLKLDLENPVVQAFVEILKRKLN